MTSLGNAASAFGVSGRKTVAATGTAEQLGTSAVAVAGVSITALSTNTGLVVVGGSDVVAAAGTRKGSPVLTAGDTAFIEIDAVSDVWLDVTVNGEGVSYSTVLA